MTGFATCNLHMIIHGFAFWEFAKPAYEHHLQVAPTLKPGFHTLTGINSVRDFGAETKK